MNATRPDTDNWWASRRIIYNLWLIGAGLLAFAVYCAVVWTRCPAVDTFEITIFTTAIQAIGYLLAMAVANVCYFVGPVSEKLFRPTHLQRYRTFTFALGVAFSVALPFLVPLSAYLFAEKCH